MNVLELTRLLPFFSRARNLASDLIAASRPLRDWLRAELAKHADR
jgi:hypothetical protein